MPQESIEAWSLRLETLITNLRKFDTEVPFEDVLGKWVTGTRPGHFLNELRKVKNQVNPDVPPLIRDQQSFDLWKNAMLSNARQTRRESERHQELMTRQRRNPTRSKSSTRFRNQNSYSNTNGKRASEPLDQSQTRQSARNPHSNLLGKPGQTPSNRGEKGK